MSYASTQFQEFPFCYLLAETHREIGFSKHYHLRLEHKLGHGKCEIIQIPCVCIA